MELAEVKRRFCELADMDELAGERFHRLAEISCFGIEQNRKKMKTTLQQELLFTQLAATDLYCRYLMLKQQDFSSMRVADVQIQGGMQTDRLATAKQLYLELLKQCKDLLQDVEFLFRRM